MMLHIDAARIRTGTHCNAEIESITGRQAGEVRDRLRFSYVALASRASNLPAVGKVAKGK